MAHSLKNTDDFYYKIYYDSCSEFEEVREMCLSENNWLRHIYLPENLIIEKHFGYGVIFEKGTNLPVGMGGLFNDGRFPSNVARQLHREYTFPAFRQNTRQGIRDLLTLYTECLVKPLSEANNFDVYFLAMQNRDKKVSKGYWKIFSETAVSVLPQYKIGSGYIQTCPFNVQKCWQNFIYYESKSGLFDAWDKTIISHDEWEKLEPGN